MSVNKCQVCGVEAAPGEVFTREGVPFSRRYRCANCLARLTRKVLQGMFLFNIAFGLFGAFLLIKNPNSEPGRVFLNIFWFTLFSYVGILPHELAHAWAGQFVGFRIIDVLMGIGPTLFTFRGFTFPVQIKAIPFGGLAFGQPTRSDRLRLRYFVFIAAGPLANFSIAALVWRLTGRAPTLTATSSATNVLVLANLVLGIESLIPFTFNSPEYGRIQSDGLSLLKLLFGSDRPFEQESTTARNWIKTIQVCFQKFCAVLLLLLGLACLGFAAWIAVQKDVIWLVVVIFALIGLLLIWFSRRAWIHEPGLPLRPHYHNPLDAIFTADLNDPVPPLTNEAFFRLRYEVAKSLEQNNFEAALQRINDAQKDFNENLWMLNAKGTALSGLRRFREAYEVYVRMLERDGLRDETRTVLATAALQSLLHDKQMDRFRIELKTTVETRNTIPEKLFVLDNMASLVLYERITALMAEALRWCEQALTLQSGNLTIRGTRASLLFETGDLVSSEAELREVYDLSESPVDKGIASMYLALICKLRDQPDQAISFARRARRHCQMSVLLVRLAAEFPEAQSAADKITDRWPNHPEG